METMDDLIKSHEYDYDIITIQRTNRSVERYTYVKNLQVKGDVISFTSAKNLRNMFLVTSNYVLDGKIIEPAHLAVNAQIIKEFIEVYKSGGMRTVVKVDKLALSETTLFKQFMLAVAEQNNEELIECQ